MRKAHINNELSIKFLENPKISFAAKKALINDSDGEIKLENLNKILTQLKAANSSSYKEIGKILCETLSDEYLLEFLTNAEIDVDIRSHYLGLVSALSVHKKLKRDFTDFKR